MFFQKGEPSKKIWYYQLSVDRNLGKTNPLDDIDLDEFIKNQFSITNNSWFLKTSEINDVFDLSVKNPNKSFKVEYRKPNIVLDEINKKDEEFQEIINRIKQYD